MMSLSSGGLPLGVALRKPPLALAGGYQRGALIFIKMVVRPNIRARVHALGGLSTTGMQGITPRGRKQRKQMKSEECGGNGVWNRGKCVKKYQKYCSTFITLT